MPDKNHDLDIDRYDIRKKSPDGVGDIAKSEFVRFLNLERTSVYMIPDPVRPRTIERSVPAKWAVVQVLSKRVNLTLKEVSALLKELGYERRTTAIRSALSRLVAFGLAVRHPRYCRDPTSWQLTERGRQLPLKLSKKGTMVTWKVEDALATKTGWVCTAELAAELQLSTKSVGGALRKMFAKNKTVRKTEPGYRRLWALKSVFDSGIRLTMPTRPARKTKKKATSTSAKAASGTSGTRTANMCLPNKPTLVKAVTDLVNEKVTTKATFSAHDITKELREKVLAEAKEAAQNLPPNQAAAKASLQDGTVWVQGLAVTKISHDDVKEVVKHLFASNQMIDYLSSFNGTYLEYGPNVTSSVDPDPAPLVPDPTSGGGAYDGSSTI